MVRESNLLSLKLHVTIALVELDSVNEAKQKEVGDTRSLLIMGTTVAPTIPVRVTQESVQPHLADRTELMSLKGHRGV